MPQMAPIKWLSLFLIFSMTFMVFCIINYYLILPSVNKIDEKSKKSSNSLIWKW
uniref:ATP synthase F0 subunit 8 n=1 Tax=Saropogon luteus TaxID=468801 RepID=UPI0031F363CD